MVAMITSELEVRPSSMPMMKTRKNKMSLDKDCCLESYSEGYRNGKKDARMNPPHTADLGTRYRYRQEGAQFEKERIIKLLESEKFTLPEGIAEGKTYMPIQEAIALIKGEQK
jgi:hypothetical protein